MSKITIEAGVNAAKFRTGLAQMRGDISNLGSKLGGIGAVITGGGLLTGLTSIIKKGDDIGDMAQRFQVSAEMLQRLGNAAEFSGTSMETVARGLQKMQANGMAAESIYNLADAVEAATSENEAFAIAEAAVGAKMATQLLPMLRLGGAEMLRLGENAKIMSDDVISSLSNAQDEIYKFQQEITGALGEVAGFLVKGITGIKTWAILWASTFYFVSNTAVEAGSIIKNAFSGNFEEAKKSVLGFANFTKKTLNDALTGAIKSMEELGEKSSSIKPAKIQGEDIDSYKDKKGEKEKDFKTFADRDLERFRREQELQEKISQEVKKRHDESLTTEQKLAAVNAEKASLIAKQYDLETSNEARLQAMLRVEELTTEQVELQNKLTEERVSLQSDLESAQERVASARESVRNSRLNFSVDDLQKKGLGGRIGTGGNATKELDVLKKSEEHLKTIADKIKSMDGADFK